jgi:hypothetical protein
MEQVPWDVLVVLVYLAVFCVAGIIGNTLVIYITAVVREPIVSRHFIIALAVVDLVTCVVVLPMTSYLQYVNFAVSSGTACRVYNFLLTVNVPFSTSILVAIAVERCTAIRWPHAHLVSPTYVITILAATSLALGSFVALTYGTYAEIPGNVMYEWLANTSLLSNQGGNNDSLSSNCFFPGGCTRCGNCNVTHATPDGHLLLVNLTEPEVMPVTRAASLVWTK